MSDIGKINLGTSEVIDVTETPRVVSAGPSWIEGSNQNTRPRRDINKEFMELKGELSDEKAKATLAEFLYNNPAFMMDILAGVKLFPMQELLFKGWERADYSLSVWGRGCSKTLAYNNTSQLLTRDRGLIALPDLLPNIDFVQEGWKDIPEQWLWNGSGWRRTDKIYVQPQKHCLKLKTRDGFSLEGSTNHLIKIWNPDTLKAEWRKYDQIKVGDYACISRGESEWGESQVQDSLDEAYLVGLLIGDSCYAREKYGLRIISMDEEILSFVEQYPCGKRVSKQGTEAKDICLLSEFAKPFLIKWGMKRSLSYDKVVPVPILKHSALVRMCLRGLFDTDGTVSKTGAVSFSTTSDQLAHQVQLLLLTNGIVSRRRKRKTPSPFGIAYQVSFSGRDAEIFSVKIGFGLQRKKLLLDQAICKSRNTNLDVVPGVKEYAQKHIKAKNRLSKELSTEWRNDIRRKDNQEHLSYTTLRRYISFFEKCGVAPEQIAALKEVDHEHFYFSPVTEIESFDHDCLDFNVPVGECYWTNGFVSHNSWLVSLFALYWAIFNPGCRIVVISFAFRASRRILEQCGKFLKDEDAMLLRACFPKDVQRGTDEWILEVPNGSTIRCLPLGDGTKIRGVRADLLVVDEFAYLPEPIIGEILRPFLAANSKIKEQRTIREREDELIQAGAMTEGQRDILEDRKKVIFLSSACFQFEHMYRRYCEWIDLLVKPDKAKEMKESGVSYFVSRIGYDAAPLGLLNLKEIEEAKRDMSEQMFNKEYGARFISDSEGFFRAAKMAACSIKDGDTPCLELVGTRDSRYIMGIDVSLSGADTSDHFAICVMKLIKRPSDGKEIGMVVHNYAVAGGNLKDHIMYMLFLIRNFNIVYMGIDASQGDEVEFINSCNQSKLFKDNNIDLLAVEADFKKDTFLEVPAQIKRSYNKTEGRIVQKQPFSSAFQKAANEYLQACIDHRGMIFAGKIGANDGAATSATNVDLSMLSRHEEFQEDGEGGKIPWGPSKFIDHQDFLVDLTRKECAMIQVKQTTLGTQQWDLPQSLKRTSGPLRIRKDSYSALLLCNWCVYMFTTAMATEVQTGPVDFPYAAY